MNTVLHRGRRASRAKAQESFSSVQADLFQRLDQPPRLESPNVGDLDIGPELMGAVNTAIRDARSRRYKREHIVERMNLALPELEKPITVRQLNSWTAKSKEFSEFPARYIPAFCWATTNEGPLVVQAMALGFELADAYEAATKRLGEITVDINRKRREAAVLTRTLGV